MSFYKTLLAAAVVAATAAGCASPSAQKQNVQAPASKASLEELFDVSDFDNIMDQTFRQMSAIVKQQIAIALADTPSDMPAPKYAAVRQVVEKYMLRMLQEANTPEVRSEIRRLSIEDAAKVYTQGEVDALVRFYKSPEGRSVMAKMPQYMEAVTMPVYQAVEIDGSQKYGEQMLREIIQMEYGKTAVSKTKK